MGLWWCLCNWKRNNGEVELYLFESKIGNLQDYSKTQRCSKAEDRPIKHMEFHQNSVYSYILSDLIMILSTTPAIEGRTITEYKGVVFGEVISGVNFLRDFGASIRNVIGGRSSSYEDELIKARTKAMNEMSDRAREMGADAVVGIDIDYEVLGQNNGMLMVTASGTAVKLQ